VRRKLITVAIVAAVVIGALATRAIWEGRSALHDGDEAAQRGDTDAAIEGWRRAARWYVPVAPHVGAAYDRLERMAAQAEAHGDRLVALEAWRAVRSSALATRWVVTPHADRKARADAHIARLMAEEPVWGQPVPEGADPTRLAAADAGATPADREAFYAKQLARDDAPSLAWVIVALIGFGVWLGGCVRFARRALDAEDRLVRRVAIEAGALVLVGLVVWVVGLYQA